MLARVSPWRVRSQQFCSLPRLRGRVLMARFLAEKEVWEEGVGGWMEEGREEEERGWMEKGGDRNIGVKSN